MDVATWRNALSYVFLKENYVIPSFTIGARLPTINCPQREGTSRTTQGLTYAIGKLPNNVNGNLHLSLESQQFGIAELSLLFFLLLRTIGIT